MTRRIAVCCATLVAMVIVASAGARPIPLVKAGALKATTFTPQIVGNGVYPATSSGCYGQPGEWPDIPVGPTSGLFLAAPSVVGVYWPGAQSPDYQVHTLFRDFVTDLFNGPYWSAVMPQYVGSAHGIYQTSVDITTLLTHAPSTTVYVRDIAGELVAQQQAGVLPAPDAQGNTIYVVHFPPGITIADSTYNYIDSQGHPAVHVSIGSSCLQFCAYHDFYFAPPRYFPFVVMPDISQNAGCQAGCGTGTPFDRYTEILSHELFESVTDPFATGWVNTCAASGGEEIADVCEATLFHVPRRTSTPGTSLCPNRWAMNSVFSNAAWNPANANGCFVTDATTQDCTAGVVPEPGLTTTLELSAPSPNPAVDGTRLRYSLPFASLVRLNVLDVAGRQVAVLSRQVEGPGAHSAAWDGRDAGGSRVSPGLYFVRLEAAGQTLSQRIAIDR